MTKKDKILVLESDRKHANIISKSLHDSDFHCEVKHVRTPDECIKKASKDNYDAAILCCNGLQTGELAILPQLRELKHFVPIVLLFETGSEQQIIKTIKSGEHHYIIKSGNYISLLPDVVEGAINQSRKINKLDSEKNQALLIQERFSNLLNSSNEGYFLFDADMKLIEINQAAMHWLGAVKREKLIGKSIDDLSPELKHSIQNKEFLTDLKDGKPITTMENIEHPTLGFRNISFRIFKVDDGIGIITFDETEKKQAEIQVNKSELRYKTLVHSVPDIIYELDADGCFTFLNDAIVLLGYEPEQLIGKHFKDLLHPDDFAIVNSSTVLKNLKGKETGKDQSPKLFDERRTGPRMTRNLEVRILRNNTETPSSLYSYAEIYSFGHYQIGEVHSSGKWENIDGNDSGVYRGSIGIIRDITERKEANEKIKNSLEEKEILIKEVHHRVKNNMQVICSLLNLQLRRIDDSATRKEIMESQERIYSMALIHEKLYQSGDLSQINFRNYVLSLSQNLYYSYQISPDKIVFSINCKQSFNIGVDKAIPCGLILNELLSNALKHAFPDNKKGTITVSMERKSNNTITLAVSDTGIGIPPDFNWKTTRTLGMEIVRILVKQLSGTIELNDEKGSEFIISFTE